MGMFLFLRGRFQMTDVAYGGHSTRIEGESRLFPNLKFELSTVQLREVKAAISHIEGKRESNIWFGPFSLTRNSLSIHALDLLNVLSRCARDAGTEIELFRIRKEAMDQLEHLRMRAEIK